MLFLCRRLTDLHLEKLCKKWPFLALKCESIVYIVNTGYRETQTLNSKSDLNVIPQHVYFSFLFINHLNVLHFFKVTLNSLLHHILHIHTYVFVCYIYTVYIYFIYTQINKRTHTVYTQTIYICLFYIFICVCVLYTYINSAKKNVLSPLTVFIFSKCFNM